MKSASALLVSCALALPFPAAAQVPPLEANCKKGPGNCEVTVIVPAGCGSGIQVAPDPLVVEAGATITWTIRSSGKWVFAGGGIKIYAPDKTFAPPKGSNADTTVTVARLTAEKGLFKYDIVLKRGDETCKHDPTIINQ